MMFKHKKMIGLLFFSALVALALLFVVSYTAMAQENWPIGEKSLEPANEGDAKVVEGAADGKDSTGDEEKMTTPDGSILLHAWYNGTGDDWTIETGDSVYRGNQSIEMKGTAVYIQAGGYLKLENVSLLNVTEIYVGGTLVLYEDGTNNFSKSVTIEAKSILIDGTLEINAPAEVGKYVSFGSLETGIISTSATVFQHASFSTVAGTDMDNKTRALVIYENDNVEVMDCIFTVSGNSVGIMVYDSEVEIKDNTFTGNKLAGSTGIMSYMSDVTDIKDNSFLKFENHAIYLIESNGEITGNSFEEMEFTSNEDPGHPAQYIIYTYSGTIDNEDTMYDDNSWSKVGSSGTLFMRMYNLTVTVVDDDSGEALEDIKVTLDGYWVDTDREVYTDEDGKAFIECTDYYVYGSSTNDLQKSGTNDGSKPYNISADDGAGSVVWKDDFDTIDEDVNDPGVELRLVQKNYDFQPTNIVLESDFTDDVLFAGEMGTLQVNVKNNGNKDATDVKIGFYLVDDTRAETLLGDDTVNVDAGQSTMAELEFAVDAMYGGSQLDFKVVANYDDTFEDYEPDNNDATKTDVQIYSTPTVTIDLSDDEVIVEFAEITGTIADGEGIENAIIEVKFGDDLWEFAETATNNKDGSWTLDSWNFDYNIGLNVTARGLDSKTTKGGKNVAGVEAMKRVSVEIPATMDFKIGTVNKVYGSGTNTSFLMEGALEFPGLNAFSTITVQIDDGTPVDANYAPGNSSWYYNWAKINNLTRDGEYNVKILATDDNSVTTILERNFLMFPDNTTTDPLLTITTPSGEDLAGDSKQVAGTVVEDYELVSIEYSIDGTTWLIIPNPTPTGTTYSWSIIIEKDDLQTAQGEEKENYNVWFKASDNEVTSEVEVMVIKITGTQTGIDLSLVDTECSVSPLTNIKENQDITVAFTVHRTGGDPNNARVDVFIGDMLLGTVNGDDITYDVQQTKVFRPSQTHVGKKDVTIKVVFDDDEDTTNNEVMKTTTAVIDVQPTVTTDDDSPGFGAIIFVGALVLAMLVFRRKD